MGRSFTLQSLYFWIKVSFVVLLKGNLNNRVKLQKDIYSKSMVIEVPQAYRLHLSVAVECCSISCCLSYYIAYFELQVNYILQLEILLLKI